jgi:hypothetical protein
MPLASSFFLNEWQLRVSVMPSLNGDNEAQSRRSRRSVDVLAWPLPGRSLWIETRTERTFLSVTSQ